jgi:O-antigen/teichoic acid export membrane protein
MSKPKLLINSLSLLVSRLTQAIVTFILTTIIARNLGADELGNYILGISYYYIFVEGVGQPLKTLFTRELAQKPAEKVRYLISGSVLQFLLSIVGYLLLAAVVHLMPYSDHTSMVCYIMGLAILPFSLSNVTEAVFQAEEKMYLIAISTVPLYILRLIATIVVVQSGDHAIQSAAAIMVGSEIIVLLIQWAIVAWTLKSEIEWKLESQFMLTSFVSAKTLFAFYTSGMIAGKMDVLLISVLSTPFVVGLYGAIGQLMQPFLIIANSVCLAAFPRLSKAMSMGKTYQREQAQKVIEILFYMSLPFMVGIFFYSKDLLLLLYQGRDFTQAEFPLQITALSLIGLPLVRFLGSLLMANGFEKYNLIEVTITTTVGGLAGIFLVSQYSIVGAACMGLTMSFTACAVLVYAVYSNLYSLNFWRIVSRPLLISSLMCLLFTVLKQTHLEFILNLVISSLFYCLISPLIFMREFENITLPWQRN